jgi:glycosyltransferase involved in cell wall biosynthesis
VLDSVRPDLVHLHAMSPAVSLNTLREIKRRAIPAVFTCHIPGITCSRGTLLHNGNGVCDGVWELGKCSSCVLQGKGLPLALARPLGALPPAVGRRIGSLGFRGSVATALRMTELQARRHVALTEFLRSVDRIVAVSAWLRDLLVANGLDEKKVVLCRQGADRTDPFDVAVARQPRRGALDIAFLGRLNAAKGVHVLVDAIRQRPELRVHLDIYGVVQDDAKYVRDLRIRIAGDTRFRLLEAIAHHDVVSTLRRYDVVAVPSQWLETGPLVVYEAFEAGIPVIASRRGGLLELIAEGRDGILVDPPDSPRAWGDSLASLMSDHSLRERLLVGVRRPRSMSDVAKEMLALYNDVLHSRSGVPVSIAAR